jgi:hypothetical protein
MFALVVSLMLTQHAPSLADGRAHVRSLRDGKVEAKFATLSRAINSYGTETRMVSEALEPRDNGFTYTRTSAVTNWARGVTVTLSLTQTGKLESGVIGTAKVEAPTIYAHYETQTHFSMPVEGNWHVLWGGHTYEENRHAAVSDMRFALDLWQKKDGETHRARGLKNEEYYAWNKPVLAPADGVVVSVVNAVEDNVPNRIQVGSLYGNVVVLKHTDGEFTLFGHLKRGTVGVKVGERITRGQRLARVGNSGMSTEPHLHFHAMDGAEWKRAQGLPLRLCDFTRNGDAVDCEEPVRGDVIAPRSEEASR